MQCVFEAATLQRDCDQMKYMNLNGWSDSKFLTGLALAHSWQNRSEQRADDGEIGWNCAGVPNAIAPGRRQVLATV